MKKDSIIRTEIFENKGRMSLIIFLGLFSVVSGAALMYVSGFLISKASLKVGNILMLQVPTVLTRTFSLSQSVFSYIQRLISHDLVLRIIAKMRNRVYKILDPMALKLKKSYKSGDLLGLLSEDIENLQNIYLKSIFPSLISLFLYVIFIAFIFGYDITYAILATLFGIFIIFIVPFISLLVTSNNLKVIKKSKHNLYKDFTSAIFGVTDLISSAKSLDFVKNYKNEENILLEQEKKAKNFIHIREIVIQFLAAIVVVLIIYFCRKMMINNAIENVYIASFCMISLSVMSVVVMTGDAISNIPSYQVAIDRVKDFYKNEVQKEDDFDINNYNSILNDDVVSIKNLFFAYENDKDVLKGLNLTIKKGEKVAILGRSGVGKSTLIKLLTGTYTNYKGTIKVFGDKPNEKLLGNKISLLNQKPYLFDMTIKENILLAALNSEKNISDEEINSSLEKAQIKELVNNLPDNLNTSVYETGGRFSGGERQRLAFARTLIQDNELLLLDEPTVGLDPKTETELLKTIFKSSEDKTILWITHHLNSIHYMDRIIFIKDGMIEMDGSHNYLYNNNEKYKKLYDMDSAL